MTITHDAMDLSVQGSPVLTLMPPDMGPDCTGISPWISEMTVQGPLPVLTSGGQDWRPVQTCSLEDPPTGGY